MARGSTLFSAFKKTIKFAKKANKEWQKAQTKQQSNFNDMTLSRVDQLDGVGFEHFVGRLFHKMGYRVSETPVTGDYGGDLILDRNGERIVVQAKRYKSNVGVSAVQEVVSALRVYNGSVGMVVTNAEFTKAAQNLARVNGVTLVGRSELANLMNTYMR